MSRLGKDQGDGCDDNVRGSRAREKWQSGELLAFSRIVFVFPLRPFVCSNSRFTSQGLVEIEKPGIFPRKEK